MSIRNSAPRGASLEAKLARYSEPYVPGRCQLWLRSTRNGYGQVFWQGRIIYTHRAAWECERGAIPDGMCVLHRCDNPPCRNIDHLFLGTHADNTADKVAKRRYAGGGPRGEMSSFAKLTEIEILEIRAVATDVPQRVIAATYRVHQTTVSKIRSGKTWAHLR